VVNDLLIRVKDIFRRLRSKLSAQPSTPEPLPPSAEEKPKVSSSYSNPRALLLKRAATAKKASKKPKVKK
jgi:hypothetical protein